MNRSRYRKRNPRSTKAGVLTRRRYRRRTQVRNRTTVPVGLGFPKKMVMTHRYGEIVATNTGASGLLGVYSFVANGLYDPNFSGTGHQPMYFDQMGALYDHYCVIGSKITVKVSKTDSSSNIPTVVGIFVNDDSTVTPTIFGLLENSVGGHRIIQGGKPTTTLTANWSAKKYFGKSALANNELQGTTSANPTELSYYTIYFDSSQSATQTSILLDVQIEYITVWKELKDIATS